MGWSYPTGKKGAPEFLHWRSRWGQRGAPRSGRGPQERRRGSPRWGGQRGLVQAHPEALGRPVCLRSSRLETQVPGGHRQVAGGLAPAIEQESCREGLREPLAQPGGLRRAHSGCPQRPGHLWRPVKRRRGALKAPLPDLAAGIPRPGPQPLRAPAPQGEAASEDCRPPPGN